MAGKAAWYVLVRSHTDGFALLEALRAQNVSARVAPAPHGVQACCGMSLLIDSSQVEAVRAIIEAGPTPAEGIIEVENAIDPSRNKFC